jgi:uncharacterized membrane protein
MALRPLRHHLAPPRFLVYALVLVAVAIGAAVRRGPALQDFLIGFDAATVVFLLSLITLFRIRDPKEIARHSAANDANRIALLVISIVVVAVVLGALTLVVASKDDYSKLLVIATLAVAWVFANTVYAIHYAHLYYRPGDDPDGYAGGISVPSAEHPDYLDFLHFSLILGMTFQTADINITGRTIRRVSTGQCLEAWIFNIGILAFSINMIAGS